MATIVFDFDSTLIRVESLEMILSGLVSGAPAKARALEKVTDLGMSGAMPFSESLRRRLELVAPTRHAVASFAARASLYLTDGIDGLIGWLHRQGHDVWVLSGGLYEVVLAVSLELGISPERVAAVRLNWNADGSLGGIDPNDPFSVSKVQGARGLRGWTKPCIAIGDGMTDFELYREGLVQHFVAYTQHRRRDALIKVAPSVANNLTELRETLELLT